MPEYNNVRTLLVCPIFRAARTAASCRPWIPAIPQNGTEAMEFAAQSNLGEQAAAVVARADLSPYLQDFRG
jgi:hypothetical protein